MKYDKTRWRSLITLGFLAIILVFLTGGCTRTSVSVPEFIQLEPPPILITADQLYEEYIADEAEADARYKGKEVWILEAIVDSYLESESGCYLMMRYVPGIADQSNVELLEIPCYLGELIHDIPSYIGGTIKLEPQFAEGFKDVEGGYLVDVVGECQGILDGVITLKINRINKAGVVPPSPPVGY